jgi:hypothetical protein
MRALIASVAAAVLFSSSAWADETNPPPAPAPAQKNDGDKIVCKREQFVGSIIPKRICMTKAQWEQGAINAKRALDEKIMWDNPQTMGGKTSG